MFRGTIGQFWHNKRSVRVELADQEKGIFNFITTADISHEVDIKTSYLFCPKALVSQRDMKYASSTWTDFKDLQSTDIIYS